jgi:hypothetical protein
LLPGEASVFLRAAIHGIMTPYPGGQAVHPRDVEMNMRGSALSGLAGAILLAVVSTDASATKAFFGASSLNLLSPTLAEKEGHITTAQNEKKAVNAKNKQKRCNFLLKNCQYSSDLGKERKICTPQRVDFMEKNCRGKK